MKKISLILAVCLAYLNINGSDAEVAGTEKRKPGIYPVGDSTMANKSSGSSEYGWGMLFPDFLNPDSVQVFNNGFDGRSTKSFISEGKWNTVLNQLQEGDCVLIQFGHNDEKQEEASLYTDPATTYRTNLTKFVNETRDKGATPVLLTSIVRRSFDANGNVVNTHGEYPDAVRATAQSLNVPLIDMERTTRLLENIAGVIGSREIHQFTPPGEIDNTHLCYFGAYIIARMVAEEIQGLTLKTNPEPLANAAGNTLDLAYRYFSDNIQRANTALATLTAATGHAGFATAIATAQSQYNNRAFSTLEEINTATVELRQAERICRWTQPTPFSATFAIGNQGFEEGVNYLAATNKPLSWKLDHTTSGSKDIGTKTSTPNEGYYKYSIWAGNITSINLYQDIVLPAGEYTLSAVMHTSSAADLTDQHLYATVGNNAPLSSAPLTYDAANYWRPLSVSFSVPADDTTLRIGATSTGRGTAAGHFTIDNVQLQKTANRTTALPYLQAEQLISTQYYNLQGIQIPTPGIDGVYIVKKIYQSGKTATEKIIINANQALK